MTKKEKAPVLLFSPVGKCSVCGKRANYSVDGVRFCGEKCEAKGAGR